VSASLCVIIALSTAPALLSATSFYTCAIKGMHV
jgi:hypothetical protein